MKSVISVVSFEMFNHMFVYLLFYGTSQSMIFQSYM